MPYQKQSAGAVGPPVRVNPFLDAPTPLGSLMSAAGQRLGQELTASLAAAGFADLRAAHAPVFMAIDPDGTRVTELAARTRMTKQAVGELIRYLTQHGYLTVTPDPIDARVRRVSLTEHGWEALATGERVIADFNAWIEQSIGPRRVAQLRAILSDIADTGLPIHDAGPPPTR